MKPFDLEAAKRGGPVVTRDGRKVRVICDDVIGTEAPILALVLNSRGGINYELPEYYLRNGKVALPVEDNSARDLFMAPQTVTRWMMVEGKNGGPAFWYFFTDEAEALLERNKYSDKSNIFVAKVEWEE